ncbi:MAG TPA: hypothetical protein DEA55_11890 [Rhodospirillaceae bacterium]|nr:hypothetical protein [Rhodospirillaceae bacterium]
MDEIRNILAKLIWPRVKPPDEKHAIGQDKPEEHPGDDRGRGPLPKDDRRHEGIGNNLDLEG